MPPVRLVDRVPVVPPAEMVAALVPPPRFAAVRFATYVPNPAEPTHQTAVEALTNFVETVRPPRRALLRGRRLDNGATGVYLDGGYGVGKTHLLASLWHAAPVPARAKSYGTFVELTHLVGALGFAATVDALSAHRLLCIDEFELDDPGDTVLVSTLLGRLADAGVKVAATSNTLPGRLGEGRFSTEDFRREIQGLSARFEAVRVDGEDYRHRGFPDAPVPLTDDALGAAARSDPAASYDDFGELCEHLSTLHPVRYGALLDGIETVHLRGVMPVVDQAIALRLVVLADRLYDRDVAVASSGVPLSELFPADLLAGGYRKKYLRAVSRLTALTRQAASP